MDDLETLKHLQKLSRHDVELNTQIAMAVQAMTLLANSVEKLAARNMDLEQRVKALESGAVQRN